MDVMGCVHRQAHPPFTFIVTLTGMTFPPAAARRSVSFLDNGMRSARASRAPVDAVRARGVPIVGRGSTGGAIAGTRPDFAVLRLDEKLRQRKRRKL